MDSKGRRHIVLCALSDLKAYGKPIQQTDQIIKSYDYKVIGFDGVPISYSAWHTNEAPIKLLIDYAIANKNPIDGIVYLRSNLCRDAKVNLDGVEYTAETYYKERVKQHLESQNVSDWETERFFIPISYEYSSDGAAEKLSEIIQAIGRNVVVDVDVSGGLRDAQLLLSHAIEFIEAGDDSVDLGTTVYASLNRASMQGKLTSQNDIYGLSGLISAIDVFMRYGRSERLAELFAECGNDRVTELCESMSDFSADLSVCRMKDIYETVKRVHECLDALEKDNDTSRSDVVLLRSLVPTIREGFVDSSGNDADRIISVMRWCVERQMLPQALALYREKAPEILVMKGYVARGEGAAEESNEKWVSHFVALGAGQPHRASDVEKDQYKSVFEIAKCALTEERYKTLGCNSEKRKDHFTKVLGIAFPDKVVDCNYVIVEPNSVPKLSANLVWYHYLQKVRNEVMHAKEEDDMALRLSLYKTCCKVFVDASCVWFEYDHMNESSPRERNKALQRDILKAIDALEGKVVLELQDDLAAVRTQWPIAKS